MAKVKIEIEDAKPTKEGGWIKLSIVVDPPLIPDENNKLWPGQITIAQELANDIAWLIKNKMTHRVIKGGG